MLVPLFQRNDFLPALSKVITMCGRVPGRNPRHSTRWNDVESFASHLLESGGDARTPGSLNRNAVFHVGMGLLRMIWKQRPLKRTFAEYSGKGFTISQWTASVLIGLIFGLLSATGAQAKSASIKARPPIDFNRQIRPILSENCFACHGPDKNKRKAGLRLDQKESATSKLESGSVAIVPGDAAASKVLKLVSSGDDDERMPPKKSGKKLTKEQIELLGQWIDQGAPWKQHWSYIPPQRAPLPAVKNKLWPRTDIDYFILARLEAEKLRPSPEADKSTLLRRVSFDLTGLPPTIAEVDAFLAEKSPKAYERVVDRLLASPQFGERMAQQWLDLARFADSDGYHADNPRSMWQYRDWVVNAFNQNTPFDQFAIEQLAGDLLPKPSLEQRVATAFNRNGMSSTEGGADPDEYANKYVTDRVNTFGTVWLGSTIACTECHDHKYDAFTQKEYYQFYDFFNQIAEKGLDSDPAPPFIKVPNPEQKTAQTKLLGEITSLESQRKALQAKKDKDLDGAQAKWEQKWRQAALAHWVSLEPAEFSAASGAQLQKLDDQSLLASGTNADKETYEITVKTSRRDVTALRLEALIDDSLPLKGSSRNTNGNFVLSSFEAEATSADPARETPSDTGLRWGTWSALGPFKAASAKEVFEKAFFKEEEIDLAKTYEDGKFAWTEKPEWTNGVVQPLSGENLVTYLCRSINVKTARYLTIPLGCDGGMQIWLNGIKPFGNKIFKGITHDPDEVLLWLKAGENKLLLKVHHGNGEYGFYFAPPGGSVIQYPVAFATAAADYNQKDLHVRTALDEKPDLGWGVDGQDEKNRVHHQAVFVAKYPVGFDAGTVLKISLKFNSSKQPKALGRFRLGLTTNGGWEEFAAFPQAIQTTLFAEGGKSTDGQKAELQEYYRDNFSPDLKALNQKLADTRKAEKELNGKIPTLRVMEDMAELRPTQIRIRGDYRNKGDRVTAGVPHILPSLPATPKTNRLALARWLVDPNHPLTSRVAVNRYWQLYFGTGLVKTGNDFGTQGELPSHPELLDWLAREFIESGWDIKALQKKIVLSAAYRQSSKVTKDLLARDPSNRLLARGPRFRFSAEMIRDNALAISGLLDRAHPLGGPSVRPYQPAGLWEDKMFGGNKYEESKGPDLYRRSLYTLWKRTVLNPTLMTFDAPDRALCTEQRSMTCTPLQAFVTMNEKTFLEASRVFAQRIVKEGGQGFSQRLGFAFKVALARPPQAREERVLRAVYDEMLANYRKDLKGAVDLMSAGESKPVEGLDGLQLVAWTTVANTIFNLDETLTKE